MKKKIMTPLVFFLSVSFCFAQSFLPKSVYQSPFGRGKSTNSKTTEKHSSAEYWFTPTVGYENFIVQNGISNIGILGLDFMYANRSGFSVWFNNAFIFGSSTSLASRNFLSSNETIESGVVLGWSPELLLGYSKKIDKHFINFGLGYQAAIGLGNASVIEFGAFTIRVDYAYFFKDKMGISIAVTDGLGGGVIGSSGGFMNSFSIKLGPTFKL